MARYVDIEPVMKSIQQLRGCTCSCSDGIIDDVEMMMDMAPDADVIPLPDNATNGDMVKAMFPNAQIDYHEKSDLVDRHVTVFIKDCDTCQDYSYEWWNSQFKLESKKSAKADRKE